MIYYIHNGECLVLEPDKTVRDSIYNIHEILKIKSNRDFGFLPRFLNDDQTSSTTVPMLSIIFRNDFYLDLRNFSKVGLHTYYDDDNKWICYDSSWLAFRLRLLLKGFEEKNTEVYSTFAHHKLSKLAKIYTVEELIESIISVRLLQKECAFLHSACLSNDDKGILLPALAETGKTTTVLSLLRNSDWKFLADDLTIISGNGEALCFPEPCSTTPNHYKLVRRDGIRFWQLRLRFLVSRMLHNQFFSSSFRTDISELVNNVKIERKTRVRTIFFLERGKKNIEEIERHVAIKKLVAINRREIRWYVHPFVLLYAYFNSGFDVGALLYKEKDVISNLVQVTDRCFVISNESNDYSSLIEELVQEI